MVVQPTIEIHIKIWIVVRIGEATKGQRAGLLPASTIVVNFNRAEKCQD